MSRASSLSKRRFFATQCEEAPFARGATRLVAASAVLTLSLTGCALQSPDAPTSSTRSGANVVVVPTKTTTKTETSTKTNAPNADRSVLGSWFRALTQPSATPKPQAVAATPVFIDIAQLAQRFPSWKLATQLDGASFSTVSLSTVSMSAPPFDSSRIALPLSIPSNRVLDIAPQSDFALSLQRVFTSGTQQSSDESAFVDGTRRRSANGLTQFLRDASQRQEISRQAQEAESRATLDDDVAAAREIVLPPLEPVGLPPAVQLEITNLRLKLLPNSNTPSAERQMAQARLFQLQAVWRDKLRAQEQQILDEWNRQREEEPRRVQREGEAQIAAETQRDRRIDAARLDLLRDEQARFLGEDFGAQNASRNALAIALPSFSAWQLRRETLAPSLSTSSAPDFRLDVRAPRNRQTSFFTTVRTTRGVDSSRAAALRAQALGDARAWAQNLARRRGWTLQERSSGARDETQSAIASLGLS